jgi:hypothetical protein
VALRICGHDGLAKPNFSVRQSVAGVEHSRSGGEFWSEA